MEQLSFNQTSLLVVVCALAMPLLAFGVIMPGLRRYAKLSAAVSIGALGVSVTASLYLLLRHWDMPGPLIYQTTWVVFGQMQVPTGVLLDPTSLLMLAVVAVISFVVQVYSLGYMAGDPGFGRYYGCMSLFAWAMMSLTVSSTLLQLYIFWELVGLSSYLLIGFWFEKFSASQAGKKAFVMTRLGDVAFLMGLILLWLQLGNLDILALTDQAFVSSRLSPATTTLVGLLIFGGIVGKSAQFPLLTWLPDAMEGPTPVSALLHSATMVAAGVYLFARMFGFFSLSPTVMTVCLAVGTISMLLASTMAMVVRDIKQVWAYSTISQLGFMLMGLGAGSLFAGMFHLVTHAGFKALLFLTAGVFIHHYDSNDMFVIGRRGGRGLKSAMICMLVAAAALSGLPPLSGFFSKELILGRLFELPNPVWFAAAAAGAFLTAYYTFRLVFIIAVPANEPLPEADAGHPQHDPSGGSRAMNVVLWILAAATVSLGFFQGPLQAYLARALGAENGAVIGHHGWLPVAALLLVLAAVAAAWFEFGRRGRPRIGFVERLPAVAGFFEQRWYLDRLYRRLLDALVDQGICRMFVWNERWIIDGTVDGLGLWTRLMGQATARLHAVMIQYRLMVMFAVVVLLALFFGMDA